MLKLALRSLLRTPGFYVGAVLVLTLGFFAGLESLQVLGAVYLSDLPVPDPGGLWALHWQAPRPLRGAALDVAPGLEAGGVFSLPAFRDLEHAPVQGVRWFAFSPASVFPDHSRLLVGDRSAYVNLDVVSGGYFDGLGLRPAAGRLLQERDDRDGAPKSAVISYGLWQHEFNGDYAAIGRMVGIDGASYVVIGVAPPGFGGIRGVPSDVWVAIATWPGLKPDMATSGSMGRPLLQASTFWLAIFGRAEPRTAIGAAAASASALLRGSAAQALGLDLAQIPAVVARSGAHGTGGFGAAMAPQLWVLFGAALLSLLMACASAGVLFWARTMRRSREMAVHRVLGASSGRVLGQGLVESLMVAAPSALIGASAAVAANRALAAMYAAPFALLGFSPIVRAPSLVFYALLAAACALFCAMCLAPLARVAWQPSLAPALAGQQREAGRHGAPRGVRALIAFQGAISVLIVASGLTFNSALVAALRQSPGFDPSGVLVFRIHPERQGYSPSAESQLLAQLIERLNAVPGVASASVTSDPPESPYASANSIWLVGPGAGDAPLSVIVNAVGPYYLGTLKAHLIAGRDLGTADRSAGARVAVVSATTARRLLPGGEILGREISFAQRPFPRATFTVVGIASDIRQPTDDVGGVVYMLYGNNPISGEAARDYGLTVVVRAGVRPAVVAPEISEVFQRLAPDFPRPRIRLLEAQLAERQGPLRFAAVMTGSLAVLAELLAFSTIFGFEAYMVGCRAREFAVCLALGASPGQVVWRATRSITAPIAAGLLAGAALAAAGARLTSHVRFGFPGLSPAAAAGSAGLLILASLLGAVLPGSRAAITDPSTPLRSE